MELVEIGTALQTKDGVEAAHPIVIMTEGGVASTGIAQITRAGVETALLIVMTIDAEAVKETVIMTVRVEAGVALQIVTMTAKRVGVEAVSIESVTVMVTVTGIDSAIEAETDIVTIETETMIVVGETELPIVAAVVIETETVMKTVMIQESDTRSHL